MLTKKEAPAPKSTPSSSTEICRSPHGQGTCLMKKKMYYQTRPRLSYLTTVTTGVFGVKVKLPHLPAFKHGGVSIMLWGCAASRTGTLHKLGGILKEENNLQFFNFTSNQQLDHWTVDGSNSTVIPNTSKQVFEWITQAYTKLLERPSHSPDLNPNENVSTMLESRVQLRKQTNLNELYRFCQEEWSNIQPELWQKLVKLKLSSLLRVPVRNISGVYIWICVD